VIHKIVPSTIWALLISEATLVTTAYVAASYLLVDVDPLLWLLYEDGILRILTLVAWIVVGIYFQDLYSNFRIRSRFVLVQQVSLVLGTAFLFQGLVSYGIPRLLLPRWVMMVGSSVVIVSVPLWRYAYSHLVVQALASEHVLFLGASPLAQEIARKLQDRKELGVAVAGFLAEPGVYRHRQPSEARPRCGWVGGTPATHARPRSVDGQLHGNTGRGSGDHLRIGPAAGKHDATAPLPAHLLARAGSETVPAQIAVDLLYNIGWIGFNRFGPTDDRGGYSGAFDFQRTRALLATKGRNARRRVHCL
jgi:hypothetical protein